MNIGSGDDQRRQRMRRALALLRQAVGQAQGDVLSWVEQPWGFELYVNGTWNEAIRLDELARLETQLPRQC